MSNTTKNCVTIIAEKKTKGMDFDDVARIGKAEDTVKGFRTQRAKPTQGFGPLARKTAGHFAEIDPITAPCEKAEERDQSGTSRIQVDFMRFRSEHGGDSRETGGGADRADKE